MNEIEYWQCVEHRTSECPVCSIVENSSVERPMSYVQWLWLRFYYSDVFPWVCVAIVLIATYMLAIHEMYNIVGGMR